MVAKDTRLRREHDLPKADSQQYMMAAAKPMTTSSASGAATGGAADESTATAAGTTAARGGAKDAAEAGSAVDEGEGRVADATKSDTPDVDSLGLLDVPEVPSVDAGILDKISEDEAEDIQGVAANLAAAAAERSSHRRAAQADLQARLRELGLKQQKRSAALENRRKRAEREANQVKFHAAEASRSHESKWNGEAERWLEKVERRLE